MSLFDRLNETAAAGFDRTEPVFVGKQSRKQLGWIPMPLLRSAKRGEVINPDRFEEAAEPMTDAQKHATKKASLLARQLHGVDRAVELGVRSLGHASRPPTPSVIPMHLKVARKYLLDAQSKVTAAMADIDTLLQLRLK